MGNGLECVSSVSRIHTLATKCSPWPGHMFWVDEPIGSISDALLVEIPSETTFQGHLRQSILGGHCCSSDMETIPGHFSSSLCCWWKMVYWGLGYFIAENAAYRDVDV